MTRKQSSEIDCKKDKRKCKHPDCKLQPSYNTKGESKGRFCKTHSTQDMVDVKNKTCEHPACKTRPTYNIVGETKARFCKPHSTPGMVNVVSNPCEHPACKLRPTYNTEGESKARFCKSHSTPGMVDVKNKTCEYPNCKTRPTYNTEGESKARFCKSHSTPGMVNVKDKTCEHPACKHQPNYNIVGESKARFCKSHSTPGMVNVKDKTCEHPDCKGTRASYGFCGQQVSACASHKTSQMFKKPTRDCLECKEQAEYGILEPTHCLTHQKLNEISLISQVCTGCKRVDILNKNKKCITYCEPEDQYKQIKKYEKTKEIMVLKYLDSEINKEIVDENTFGFQDDKTVKNECDILNRPDRIYDCKTHFVIVEIDENQHKGKRASCSRGEVGELARMNNIQLATGMNCIFLRFNPDNFRVGGVIQKVNMCERLTLLVKWVKVCFTMVPERDFRPVQYKKLYFDEWNKTDVSFLSVNDINLI